MEKHEHSIHRSNKRKIKKVRIWQASTAILGILLIISIFMGGFTKSGLNEMSGQTVADKTIDFINQNLLQGQETATLEDVEESNGLYNLKLSISGQEMDSYVTKDGKLLFPQAINLDETPEISYEEETTEVEKSDTPVVELFVMSHCPYGTQMEKGILPVVTELGDKIDSELKFVNYAMHPTQGEVEEQLNQYCIQRDYNDKFIEYLGKFLENGDGEEALIAVGLTETDISGCIEETDEEFDVIANLEDESSWASGRFPRFLIHDADNQKYGVQGSPTLVINGQQAQSGRDAQSILNTICGAFTDEPEECNTDMTSFGNPAPGFGFDTQGGSATAAGCGV